MSGNNNHLAPSSNNASEGVGINLIHGTSSSNAVPSRKISSNEPSKNSNPVGGFLTPTVMNKAEGIVHNSPGRPSIEVTPTAFLNPQPISKHNSFYDECLRLNTGNTASGLPLSG